MQCTFSVCFVRFVKREKEVCSIVTFLSLLATSRLSSKMWTETRKTENLNPKLLATFSHGGTDASIPAMCSGEAR